MWPRPGTVVRGRWRWTWPVGGVLEGRPEEMMEESPVGDTALPQPSRAELLVEMTELEDQIREITPSLKKNRNAGLGLTGLAVTGVASGMLWAGSGGFLIGVLAVIFSIRPWFFFGLSAADVRGLRGRISAIDERMKEMEPAGEEGS